MNKKRAFSFLSILVLLVASFIINSLNTVLKSEVVKNPVHSKMQSKQSQSLIFSINILEEIEDDEDEDKNLNISKDFNFFGKSFKAIACNESQMRGFILHSSTELYNGISIFCAVNNFRI